jgi:hypothetical protein
MQEGPKTLPPDLTGITLLLTVKELTWNKREELGILVQK